MKNKWTDKAVSATGTILFVGLVQNPDANYIALAALTVGLYEACLWVCRIARREAYKSRKRHYITVSKVNGKRWAATRIGWPMREIS